MASSGKKFSYQRLKHEVSFHEPYEDDDLYNLREKVIGRPRIRSSSSRFRKVHIRKKLRIKIPRFRRLLKRKTRLLRVACAKILRRLKEGQNHFGDLFAGNYLFMQVTPTPLKYADKASRGSSQGDRALGLSSRYSLPGVV